MGKIIIGVVLMNSILFGNIGLVKRIKGTLEIKRKGKIIIAKVGTTLENGDILSTKAKSSTGIMFDDGTRVSLEEKSIFIINKFIVKPEKKKYHVDLELRKGKAMFSTGKIGKLSPNSFKLTIPKGAVGIRGTKFIVEVE